MGCVKLHILDEQYKSTELKVSYSRKELTSNFCAENLRSGMLIKFIDPDGRQVMLPPVLGGMNPVMLGTNTPLLGAADLVKVGGETVAKTGVTRVAGKTESHHLIPRSLKGNEVVKAARDGGFKLDGKGNRTAVEKFSKSTGEGQHGKHSNYTRQIENKLKEFGEKNPNATPEQAAKAVEKISGDAASDIKNNPDIKINDLKLNEVTAPTDNTKVVTPQILDIEKTKTN